jgi:hypothetical protein
MVQSIVPGLQVKFDLDGDIKDELIEERYPDDAE